MTVTRCTHFTDAKNVVVYQCKADYTADEEGSELTINKGDHVNVLEKSDGGMCSDDTSTRTYMHNGYLSMSKVHNTHQLLAVPAKHIIVNTNSTSSIWQG